MQDVIEYTKKGIEEDEELQGMELDFILINPNNFDTISIVSDGQEKILEFTPFTKNMETGYSHVPEWDYNLDDYLFKRLEEGYQIGYMSEKTHDNVWDTLQEYFPSDIEHINGVQLYLQYCIDNGTLLAQRKNLKDYETHIKQDGISFDDNKILLFKGNRGEQPVALIKWAEEYVIAIDYTIDKSKIYWSRGYYYSDVEKAKEDFDRVIRGEYLYNDPAKQEKTIDIKYVGVDNLNRPVYKDKDGTIYKDISLGNEVLILTTVNNNDFFGEPKFPIKDNVKVNIVEKLENEQKRRKNEQER